MVVKVMDPSCHLYWPVGVEEGLGVEVEGPVATRIGDVQMLFRQPAGVQGPHLTVYVWSLDTSAGADWVLALGRGPGGPSPTATTHSVSPG